jgi:hypothetical protein
MFLNFSAKTSANQTQDIIDSKLDKRRKGVIGPPIGKKCIIMVDDLNMPAKEEYGAQPPIEILRQWMDHAGWYDRTETVYRELVDIQFIAAMGPPGGGRTFITQRYVRHFNLLFFAPFSDVSLARVFNTIVTWFLAKGDYADAVTSAADSMVKATIEVYNTISANLLPTPSKSHCECCESAENWSISSFSCWLNSNHLLSFCILFRRTNRSPRLFVPKTCSTSATSPRFSRVFPKGHRSSSRRKWAWYASGPTSACACSATASSTTTTAAGSTAC